MKTQKILFLSPFLLLVFFIYSCSTAGYEIEETEGADPIEHSGGNQEKIQNKDLTGTEKKIDYVNNRQIPVDKTTAVNNYTIQIGAFSNLKFAENYSAKARTVLNLSTDIVNEEGLYRIRIGSYHSLQDASGVLENIKSSGFSDSFIIALGK